MVVAKPEYRYGTKAAYRLGMTTSTDISACILEAVLARKLLPGHKLSEQQLASLFGCSRTIVREALTRLAVRRLVTSSVGSGWYVAQPSREEAFQTFEARRVIETGLLRLRTALDKATLRKLRQHLKRQKLALQGGDIAQRSFLLGDFHVCLADCLGNPVLAETLRDLTARTTLIALHHQSDEEALHSYTEHTAIVAALEAGDLARAQALLDSHLDTWDRKLPLDGEPHAAASADPVARLRRILQPLPAGIGWQAPPILQH